MKKVYRWCTGCERRIDESLFANGSCPGCIKERESSVAKKVKRQEFTEEEYEEMSWL